MKTIAIIEDDQDIREMYKMKLQMNGYNVIAVDDGRFAKKFIEEEEPDLVLLDLLLPDKDGFDVLKEIRGSANEKLKNIPVIVISNLSNKEDINEAKKIGVSDYLIKFKIKPNEIVEKVDSFFKKIKINKSRVKINS